MAHWTHVLSNVSLVEFVLLAALTTLQWARHRIRGAGWVALSFAILGGIPLAMKIDPEAGHRPDPDQGTRCLAPRRALLPFPLRRHVPPTGTCSSAPSLSSSPAASSPSRSSCGTCRQRNPAPPPYFLAYRVSFLVAFGFLCGYVVVSLFGPAGVSRRSPPPACTCWRSPWPDWRSRWWSPRSACRVPTVELVTQALTVVMGVLFLVALVLPSFVRVFLNRKEDVAFRRAVGELVSAGDSQDVAERLLPHVRTVVGGAVGDPARRRRHRGGALPGVGGRGGGPRHSRLSAAPANPA